MRHTLCDILRWTMPAIASLEDLKAAQKDLQEAKDLTELKGVFKKWRRIGWKNVCGAPWERVEPFKGWVGATSRPRVGGLLLSG